MGHMSLPIYSAGPICEGFSCWPFALVFILDSIWIVVGVLAVIVAIIRWVLTKKIDRISVVFGIAGILILSYGLYNDYAFKHRFDAESRAAIAKLRAEVPWPTQLPDGWKVKRLVSQEYGKNPSSAYVYAEFADNKNDGPSHNVHIFDMEYTDNSDQQCGYASPDEWFSSGRVRVDPRISCVEFYVLPSNEKVYKKQPDQSKYATYFLRRDGLVIALRSVADDNSIKAFFVRLYNTPAQELPFIAN